MVANGRRVMTQHEAVRGHEQAEADARGLPLARQHMSQQRHQQRDPGGDAQWTAERHQRAKLRMEAMRRDNSSRLIRRSLHLLAL
jgi:hypothetical protein